MMYLCMAALQTESPFTWYAVYKSVYNTACYGAKNLENDGGKFWINFTTALGACREQTDQWMEQKHSGGNCISSWWFRRMDK